MKKTLSIFGIAIVALCIVAVFFWNMVGTSNVSVYKDVNYGFEFEYPKDWKEIGHSLLQSKDYESALHEEAIDQYELLSGGQIVIFVQKPSSYKSLSELENFYSAGNDGPRLTKEKETAIQGENALLYNFTGVGGYKGYILSFIRKDEWIGISVQHKNPKAAEEILNMIISTFKFK